MFGGSYEKSGGDFEPLPKGKYKCNLENAVIETSQAGKKFLQMDCVIVDGEHAKRKIWHRLFFTKEAYNIVSQQLDNLGIFDDIKTAPKLEDWMMNVAEAVFKMVGKDIEVSITGHREYNDKKYPNSFITSGRETSAPKIPNMAPGKGIVPPNVDAKEKLPF